MEPVPELMDPWDHLENYILPAAVFATRKDESSPWKTGGKRNARHRYWKLDHGEGQRIRFQCFDMCPGSSLANDEVTYRLYFIIALGSGLTSKSGPITVRSLTNKARQLFWFIQFRIGLGIKRNSDLIPDHLEIYIRLLARTTSDLLPLRERLLDAVLKARAEGRFLPTKKRRGMPVPNWKALNALLGVNGRMLSHSRHFREELRAVADVFPPDTYFGTNKDAEAKRRRKQAPPRATRKVEDEFGEPRRAEKSISNGLQVIDHLWRLTQQGALSYDPLRFRPFKHGELKKIAAEVGRKGQRTRTLDPQDLFSLCDRAVFWCFECAPVIEDALTMRLNFPEFFGTPDKRVAGLNILSRDLDPQCIPGMPKIWLGWREEEQAQGRIPTPESETTQYCINSRISLTVAVQCLLVAAYILIAVFAARRVGEVDLLRTQCIREEEPGVFDLSIYIEKTMREFDWVPVPPMIRSVVRMLERLTEDTRGLTGADWLFEFRKVGTMSENPGRVGFDFNDHLPMFAAVNDLPMPKGRTNWNVASHELRRGFAIFFFYGFDGAEFSSLAWLLRHYDFRTTQIYITDILPGRILQLQDCIEARRRLARENMDDKESEELIKKLTRFKTDLVARVDDFADVGLGRATSVLLDLWMGKLVVGKGVKRLQGKLNQMADEVEEITRIGARSNMPGASKITVMDAARKVAADLCVRPVPGLPLGCMARRGVPEDMAIARCLIAKEEALRSEWVEALAEPNRDDVDYAFSSLLVCLKCDHCIANGEQIAPLQRRLGHLEEAAKRGGTSAIQSESAGLCHLAAETYETARIAGDIRHA